MKTFWYFQIFDFRYRPQSKTWKPWKIISSFFKVLFPILFYLEFLLVKWTKKKPPKNTETLGYSDDDIWGDHLLHHSHVVYTIVLHFWSYFFVFLWSTWYLTTPKFHKITRPTSFPCFSLVKIFSVVDLF